MEHTTEGKAASKTTPKDFFFWAIALVSLYGGVTSLITLLFQYINFAFPDPLAYASDPYNGPVRVAMAGVIVLFPVMLLMQHLIRQTVFKERAKEHIWVRRWALGLTLFIAAVIVIIDLITLLTTFLGGEVTVRFLLKVAVVLLVATEVFLHFLAEAYGHWFNKPKSAGLISSAILALAVTVVASGFFIIGTPADARLARFDERKVQDLQSIQYQLIDYWRVKGTLPASLADLKDPLVDQGVPTDPQDGSAYRYAVRGGNSFELCATFNAPTRDLEGRGRYGDIAISGPGMGPLENWRHAAGETCFARTIDPDRYPPIDPKAVR
jgi:hypothetical protein